MTVDVRFVLAPFLPTHQPALGVSSLKAVLARHGLRSDVAYLNIDYLERVDPGVCDLVAKFSQVSLLGEMLFARALWGDAAPRWNDYLQQLDLVLDRQQAEIVSNAEWTSVRTILSSLAGRLEAAYDEGPRIVSAWAERLLDGNPGVIGFSTTFQQNVASLALAREVRLVSGPSGPLIVLGGANCEGEMGKALAANFPFLDAVVSGEAEEVIVPLVRNRHAYRRGGGARLVTGVPVQAMDDLPVPDFDDYFAAVRGRAGAGVPNLTAEAARGCWWGAKAHCKFCGLNGNTMEFRSKSAPRAASELRELAARYGIRRFLMTDNILDTHYFQTLLPQLFDDGLELFYEIKSNLRRDQVLTLARAGTAWVQPGIESLDSGVLKLIDKGCTRLQNLQLLKWCDEAGIRPLWSILYGFPGETAAAFESMADLMPALVHLTPPMQASPFQMHRFSPYHFDAPKYGLSRVRPFWTYAWAFAGLPEEELARIAYCFEFDYDEERPAGVSVARMLAATAHWIGAHKDGAQATIIRAAGQSSVLDSRFGKAELHPLTPLEERLLVHLEESRPLARLAAAVDAGESAVADALGRFHERRWIVEEDARALSLVIDYVWSQELRAQRAERPRPRPESDRRVTV